jgi:hypothetical protein
MDYLSQLTDETLENRKNTFQLPKRLSKKLRRVPLGRAESLRQQLML